MQYAVINKINNRLLFLDSESTQDLLLVCDSQYQKYIVKAPVLGAPVKDEAWVRDRYEC